MPSSDPRELAEQRCSDCGEAKHHGPCEWGPFFVARCPEHGVHGQRETCFECGGSVKQITVVPVAASVSMSEAASDRLRAALAVLVAIEDRQQAVGPASSARGGLRAVADEIREVSDAWIEARAALDAAPVSVGDEGPEDLVYRVVDTNGLVSRPCDRMKAIYTRDDLRDAGFEAHIEVSSVLWRAVSGGGERG